MADVHIIHGSDRWLCRQTLKQLLAASKMSSAAVETVSAKDLGPVGLLDRLGAVPLFAAQRCVWVEDAECMTAWPQAQLTALKQCHSAQDSVTLMIYMVKSFGKSKNAASLRGFGKVHDCLPLTEWQHDTACHEMQAWVRQQRKSLTQPAARLLIEWLGTDRDLLYSELQKLLSYMGERGEIRENDVVAVSLAQHIHPFALTDAVLENNGPRFMRELALRLRDEHPLPLLGLLAGQFRLLLQLWAHRGQSPETLAALLGRKPFVITKTLKALPHWPMARCSRALQRLHQCDIALKGLEGSLNFPESYFMAQCARIWI